MSKNPKLKWSNEEEKLLLNLVEEVKVPGTNLSLNGMHDHPNARF